MWWCVSYLASKYTQLTFDSTDSFWNDLFLCRILLVMFMSLVTRAFSIYFQLLCVLLRVMYYLGLDTLNSKPATFSSFLVPPLKLDTPLLYLLRRWLITLPVALLSVFFRIRQSDHLFIVKPFSVVDPRCISKL